MNNESKNPLASLLIITYKQEHCIVETLNSAVSQDYDNLEIVVSDDHSPDNTYKIIEEYVANYSGPHKFIINRNEQNLRIVGNLNKAIELSHGDYLISLAGDDIAEPNRVRLSVEKLNELNVLSVTFNMNIFSDISKPSIKWVPETIKESVYTIDDYLRGEYWSCGASRAIKKDIFEIFGLIENSCPTEDSTLDFRSFLSGGLGYCPIVTNNYRKDGNNISSPINFIKYINTSLIYNQYKKDLDTAKRVQLIDEKKYCLLFNHIKQYKAREDAVRIVFEQKTLFKRIILFTALLLSPKLNMKSKVFIYKKIKFWHSNNLYNV